LSLGIVGLPLDAPHHHALVFSPHVPGSGATPFYDGQDGGIAMYDGSNFTNINGPDPGPGKAIATNLLRNIDIGRGSSTNNKYTYGGMQDTGTGEFTSSDTPNTWHLHIDGDGAGVAVDPFDPTHAVNMDDACLNQTTNGGSSWSGASMTGTPPFAGGPGFGFGNTLVFDGVNSGGKDNTVYASIVESPQQPLAGQGCFGQGTAKFAVYKSTDGGGSYKPLFQNLSAQVNAIATSSLDPNTLWFALNDGNLQVTTNATAASPTVAAPTTQPPPAGTSPATAIATDPTNPQIVVVTYAGVCGASCNNKPNRHVYQTTDGGATWTDISGTNGGGSNNLPDLPVHAVVIDANVNPHAIVVANDAGVLQSGDNGATWQVLGLGMPFVDVIALSLDTSASPELLRAGTFGRSAFELGAPTGPLLSINTTQNFGVVCPGGTPTTLLQLFNLGTTDLTITNIKRISGSTDFAVSGPGFSATIKPGEEVDWTIQLSVTSSSTNPETAVFEIDSDDTFNPAKQVAYTATIGQPKASALIADNGDFGNVCAGSFADLNLTVPNSGSCNLNISSLMFTPSLADFKAPTTTFPTSVEAGGSLQIPIRFAPATSTSGPELTTISVLSNNPGTDPSVIVTGNAPPGKIAVSGSTGFGNVCAGTNAKQVLTIGNVGPCNLSVTGVSISLNANGTGVCPDFTIENNPFPNTLSHDSSLPVTIAFTPTSVGTKTCTLTITSDDPTNSKATYTLTATTPTPSIDVPPNLGFPATVIQSVGACNTPEPFPVSNKGTCNLTVNSVALGGTNSTDYALSGLPSSPIILEAGHTIGDGDFAAVFAPTAVSRDRQATLTVTYEDDPITHHTASVARNLCGEGARTGVRILVTAGGVPIPMVDKIMISRLTSNRKSISVDNAMNLPLQTVTQAAPCASFLYHREYGGLSNPVQLTTGDYQATVSVTIGKKKKSQTVSFHLDTCTFNQNVVVSF
jgi:hypothetical protein